METEIKKLTDELSRRTDLFHRKKYLKMEINNIEKKMGRLESEKLKLNECEMALMAEYESIKERDIKTQDLIDDLIAIFQAKENKK